MVDTVREPFWLRIATDPESYVLNDVWPMVGNSPTLFCFNDDDTVSATVRVETSEDRETWSLLTSVTVVKKGSNEVAFTTPNTAKYVRFKLAADCPGGVRCTLVNWAYDPIAKARV